jgi:IPT/TIG domain
VVSATQITAPVPTGSLTGKIMVTGSTGTGSSSTNFKVLPTITNFSPTSGPIGTLVTINGTGFTTASVVRFHGTIASSMTYVSATQIKARVASGTTTGLVKVTTNGGSVTSTTKFTKTK